MTASSLHTASLRLDRSFHAPAGASVLRSWPGALNRAELPRCSARSIREQFMLSAFGVAAPIPSTAFYGQRDPVCELRVSLNRELSMSAGNASLGHACVSPASDADQKATGEFAGVRQPFSDLGKGSADGRSR